MTSAPLTVRICHLYPWLLSVAGDRGNLFALMQRCAWRGIQYSVTEADVGDLPDLTESDLILMHGGQDREMTEAARDLAAKGRPAERRHRAGRGRARRVRRLSAARAVLRADGRPAAARARGARRGVRRRSAALHRARGRGVRPRRRQRRQLTGFENHSGRTYLGPGVEPLGRVVAGGGNNGEDRTEGARYRQVYATYLHGPVLPKNPWLTDLLIGRALAHRYRDVEPLAPLRDTEETQAHDAALRLAKISGPVRTSTKETKETRTKETRWISR